MALKGNTRNQKAGSGTPGSYPRTREDRKIPRCGPFFRTGPSAAQPCSRSSQLEHTHLRRYPRGVARGYWPRCWWRCAAPRSVGACPGTATSGGGWRRRRRSSTMKTHTSTATSMMGRLSSTPWWSPGLLSSPRVTPGVHATQSRNHLAGAVSRRASPLHLVRFRAASAVERLFCSPTISLSCTKPPLNTKLSTFKNAHTVVLAMPHPTRYAQRSIRSNHIPYALSSTHTPDGA